MNSDIDRLDQLLERWEELTEAGEDVSPAELCRECPELLSELQRRIDGLRSLGWMGRFQAREGQLRAWGPGSEPVAGYRLLRPLGRGGYGEVWKAAGPDGSLVGLKLVPLAGKGASTEWHAVERVRRVRHPNVLTPREVWLTDSVLIIAMDLADGSLLDRFCQARAQGLPGIPCEELCRYMAQAAAGIDALHEHNLHHRDIKPSNLLLIGGVVKVADFGLTCVLTHSLTGHTGVLTLAYASPENFDGRTSRQGDQYSLAVSYCQLLGGRLPFDGTPAQVVAGHLKRPPDLDELPEHERRVVARALHKEPTKRWPSCTAFVAALASADEPPPRRRRWPIVTAVVAVGIALAVAVLLLMLGEPGPDRFAAFVFDGKSRIVTPLERFAPCTLEAWVWLEPPPPGQQERYIIGSDIATRSGISLGVKYGVHSPLQKDWDWEHDPTLIAQVLAGPRLKLPWGPQGPLVPHKRWSHIAAVFGEHETTIFLNGRDVGHGVETANRGGTVFVVGNAGRDNAEGYMKGRIRAVRISRGERYTGRFRPATKLTRDGRTVLLYDASATEPGKAIDLSGQENHGRFEGVTVDEVNEE